MRRARCTARRTRNTRRRMTSTRSPRISFVIASSAICSKGLFVPQVPSAICSTKCRCHDYETTPNRVSPSGVLPPVRAGGRPSHERGENVPGICSRLHPHGAIDGCKRSRDFAKNGSGVGRSGERSRAVREEGGRRTVKRADIGTVRSGVRAKPRFWKLEAALKCRSCKKGRYAPPLHMIKLTETRRSRLIRGTSGR